MLVGVGYATQRKKYEELHEAWEQEYGPLGLSYKDLYLATKGFKDSGGFGKAFRGMLPSSGTQVAVKRISLDSNQGMKEFVAEIASMRRRKGELLLVYDYMPNGSLDNFLFSGNKKPNLSWLHRINIIKGVASALLYLHEKGEQVVLHRDVKLCNVLLGTDMNARLGYLAPELTRTWTPSAGTDWLLENRVFCLHNFTRDDFVLVTWICDSFKKGAIVDTSDPRLQGK
ncbi:hypothetical protein Cgig2_004959 [Carnegiea gigantea]|uniref:non-specific serine/threonine protein kinase n=1 Tax=Carnegiea gigantea TaxID=171969 RepID=A0A9Q1QRG7_9CARY|nr:hypothetical protein Cgig2_004959 [Carnegiea gigantea]